MEDSIPIGNFPIRAFGTKDSILHLPLNFLRMASFMEILEENKHEVQPHVFFPLCLGIPVLSLCSIQAHVLKLSCVRFL